MWYVKMYFSGDKEFFEYDSFGMQGYPVEPKVFPFLESLLSFQELDSEELAPELERICEDLRTIFDRPWFLKDEDYYCTMSMGVVCFPTDGNNIDDLNRKANIALSTAKISKS